MSNKQISLRETKLNGWVLGSSGFILLLFLIASMINIKMVSSAMSSSLNWVTSTLGSTFSLIVFINLLFCIYLIFSKLGSIRLGKLAKPEMSTFTWIAILSCTAISAGPIFYGPGEPLTHFSSVPPLFADSVQSHTQQAAVVALQYAYLHFGFTPWAIYAIFIIPTMIAVYHKGLPFKPSSAFYFVLGEKRIKGVWGKVIDIFSILAVVGGVMATIGLLVMQLSYMLERVYGIPNNTLNRYFILTIITVIFTISCIKGVDKGTAVLSRWNVYFALILAGLIFILGPTQFIVDILVSSVGGYFQDFIKMSLFTDAVNKTKWLSNWSYFYWAWWIGWGPVIGLFFARISRGRTIREIIITGLSISGISLMVWFSVLGGTGIFYDIQSGGAITNVLKSDGMESGLLSLLSYLPFADVFIFAFIIALILFLVTGADSVALTASIVSTGLEEPNKWIRLFWGLLIGAIAAIFLQIGGLSTLQTGAIVTAPPIAVMMVLLLLSVPKQLKQLQKEQAQEKVLSSEEVRIVDEGIGNEEAKTKEMVKINTPAVNITEIS